MPRSLSRAATGWGVLVLGLAAGCQDGNPLVPVFGTVSYNGKLVTDGTVVFVSEADPAVRGTGPLRADGKYVVLYAPRGRVKVYIDMSLAKKAAKPGKTKVFRPPIGGRDAPPPGPYVPIPDKYEQLETSDLLFEVKGGTNEINIELR
jgi:hypothetical protein